MILFPLVKYFTNYFQIFSPIIRMMLTHQSSVDAVACLFAILLLVQPLNWIPGVYILDTLICHLWNGQFIYWYSIFISGELEFWLVHQLTLELRLKIKRGFHKGHE